MGQSNAIIKTGIKELKKLFSGKVRDIYEISKDRWLIVTTDRLSAFDVVFNEGIPEKGLVLNSISNKWFSRISFIPNHLLSTEVEKDLPFMQNYEGLSARSVLVKKVNRLPVECVVRGFLFGSVYEEYMKKGTAGGNKLPEGLKLAEKLPQPIFTPSTKAEKGHDENIDYAGLCRIVEKKTADLIIENSIKIYNMAAAIMENEGVILADTKFEFGLDENGSLILVDEVLTPDSSRYWDKDSYQTGISPKSYDKQFVRDYLNTLNWDKKPPAPPLPADIIMKTKEKYDQLLAIISRI